MHVLWLAAVLMAVVFEAIILVGLVATIATPDVTILPFLLIASVGFAAYIAIGIRLIRSGAWTSAAGVSLRGPIRNRSLRWSQIDAACVSPSKSFLGRPLDRIYLVLTDGSEVTVPTVGRYGPPFASKDRLPIIASAINAARPPDSL